MSTQTITTAAELAALPQGSTIRDREGDVGIVRGEHVDYPETALQTFERAAKKYGPFDVVRFTTCACPNPDGPHDDQQALTRSHALESDAEIIARHTGRHVVPVSEIRTEVEA